MGGGRSFTWPLPRRVDWYAALGLAEQDTGWCLCAIRCQDSRCWSESTHLQALQKPCLHFLLRDDCLVASGGDEGSGSTPGSALRSRWRPLAATDWQELQGLVKTSAKLDRGRGLFHRCLLCGGRLNLSHTVGFGGTFRFWRDELIPLLYIIRLYLRWQFKYIFSCIIRLVPCNQTFRPLEQIQAIFAKSNIGRRCTTTKCFLNFGVKHFFAFFRLFVLDLGRIAHNDLGIERIVSCGGVSGWMMEGIRTTRYSS